MNIRDLRLGAKLTQTEVATQLGVNQKAVSQWETGESMPRADKLPELARLLGCTVDELLGSGAAAKA